MAVPETESAGLAAAAATAVCWSFSAVFFSAAARRVGQYHVNQVRLVQACVLLAIACAALGLYAFVPLRQLVLLSLSGLVGLTLGDAAGFKSLQILGARRASLLGALVPGIVAVMMWPLLNESLSVVGVLGMIITVAGIMWVVLERGQPGEIHGSAALGVFLGVLGAVGQAAGQLFSTAGMGMAAPHGFMNEWAGVTAENVVSTHPMLGTLVRMVAGCALLLAFAAARRTLAQTAATLKDGRALAQTTGGAFFGPFIGVTLSLTAFKYANPAVASTVIATSPVLVIPIVRIVYKQQITPRAVIGALVAVAGVAVLALRLEIAAWF
jgi:drug/metabolite transporter (DMT)-like permease